MDMGAIALDLDLAKIADGGTHRQGEAHFSIGPQVH
jgi:hypothetical protein